MKRLHLLFFVGIGLALQDSRAQSEHSGAQQQSKEDSMRAAPAHANSEIDSLNFEGGQLLDSWAGHGEAGRGVWLGPQNNQAFYFFTDSGKACLTIHPSGKIHCAGSLSVNGTTTTKILSFTGGADIAEPFPVSERDSVAAGAVVVIDENNPGQLKLCRTA